MIRQPSVLRTHSTCWKFRKLESANELHELWLKYAGCRRLREYPRIKHERRVGDSRDSAVLGCIYAPDKSADCIFFIILVGALVFPALFFPLPLPSPFFELLQRAPCRCNISTLTDIKIHKQSEPRGMGGLILFPDNDWSELFISMRKEREEK